MDIDKIGSQLQKSGKYGKLKAVAESEAGKRLGAALDERAVERAAKSGDVDAMREILRQVLSTEDGQTLARQVSEAMK